MLKYIVPLLFHTSIDVLKQSNIVLNNSLNVLINVTCVILYTLTPYLSMKSIDSSIKRAKNSVGITFPDINHSNNNNNDSLKQDSLKTVSKNNSLRAPDDRPTSPHDPRLARSPINAEVTLYDILSHRRGLCNICCVLL